MATLYGMNTAASLARVVVPTVEKPIILRPGQYRGTDGYLFKEWFCKSLKAAERIIVALIEGDRDLADQVLLHERDACFEVGDVRDRLAVYRKAGLVHLRGFGKAVS